MESIVVRVKEDPLSVDPFLDCQINDKIDKFTNVLRGVCSLLQNLNFGTKMPYSLLNTNLENDRPQSALSAKAVSSGGSNCCSVVDRSGTRHPPV